MAAVYWISPPPTKCDTCDASIARVFFDARTSYGPCACMCPTCQAFGPGLNRLGPGLGQKFELQPDGRWLKTAG
jgi:hypothetical protein